MTRDTWSGRVGFILATVGSAVGIGSIWKFPYEVGENGGGAFVLFYFAGLAVIVVPLMFAEFAIGRRGQGNAVTSIRNVVAQYHASRSWAAVGLLGVVSGFLILSFYSVIGGWTLAYALDTVVSGLAAPEPRAVQARFDSLLASPWRQLVFHALFLLCAMLIVARGIQGGIETAMKVLMPALAVLMIALATYSVLEGDLIATLRYLFLPDMEKVTPRAALEALGLGFFSIGVGMCLMMTYAAYADADINLRQVAIVSIVADTAISLLAGLAVFPIVFAYGLNPAGGPGLVFVTLPLAFAQMPFGAIAATGFFLLLFIAALASAMSMLEIIVALLIANCGWSRWLATLVAGTVCFMLGIGTVLSFNSWAVWFPLGMVDRFATATVFDLLDYFTSNVLLPIGGFALAILIGWALPARLLEEELALRPARAVQLRGVLRYIVPVVIAAITLASIIF
ncbi:MAG: sodium-dependent transporter [Burkholderiales bacterium]